MLDEISFGHVWQRLVNVIVRRVDKIMAAQLLEAEDRFRVQWFAIDMIYDRTL
jgi:hypothetical protein